MDPGGNWRGDNWCGVIIDAFWVAGSASEVARNATEGAAAGVQGRSPWNVLEFKRANYPEKQYGTSWQEI